VVAEARVAPGVLVVARDDVNAADDDVIEPVAHSAVGVQPAAVATAIAVQRAERVNVPMVGEAHQEGEFGTIVTLAVLGADASGTCAGERVDLALAGFVSRRVEVANEHPGLV
jgi:hypothetical protein